MKSVRRALYGGSFDPPHFGHQFLIHYLLESGRVDEVRVIPCNDHPLGKPLSPFAERAAWCEALVKPFKGRAVVDTVEAELPIPSYSFQTAEALSALFPDDQLHWVIGSDAAAQLDQWVESQRLMAVAPLLIIGRQGSVEHPNQLPLEMPDVSSSEIRRRLRDGQSLSGLVPERVALILNKPIAFN